MTLKRIKKLEIHLMPALRHVMVKIRSGVSLFRALAGLCQDYGELSKEMKIVVDKTNAGVPLTESLEESATKNPSDYYRRALWQITSTLKAGADINDTLSSIVSSFSDDQILMARKYGRELNFWSVLYLVFSIVFPTLMLSFLVVLSTFLGFVITFSTLMLFLVLVFITQFLFFSTIKNRKPLLVG
jgi:pilus assembly protein TadC